MYFCSEFEQIEMNIASNFLAKYRVQDNYRRKWVMVSVSGIVYPELQPAVFDIQAVYTKNEPGEPPITSQLYALGYFLQ